MGHLAFWFSVLSKVSVSFKPHQLPLISIFLDFVVAGLRMPTTIYRQVVIIFDINNDISLKEGQQLSYRNVLDHNSPSDNN
jgi:hypothetical protein